MLNAGIYKNPSDPAFERAFSSEFLQVAEYPDKTILHNIICVVCIACIPHTDSIHFGGKLIVEHPLTYAVTTNAPCY